MPRLHRSRTFRPGIRRRRSGTGFSYTAPEGSLIQDADERERIADLAIPPAWKDVWISPDPLGHILATGVDDAGRRQYMYHPAWRERRDRTKFERALDLAEVLPGARAAVTRDLRGDDERMRVLAAAFRLLDTVSPRIGGEHYLETNGSHGLSTLLASHVVVRGDHVSLAFVGKGGIDWQAEFDDEDLARVLKPLSKRGSNGRLLAWKVGDDWHPATAHEINDYVRERTHGSFTAKDFRTLRGTIVAASSLAESTPSNARRERKAAVVKAMTDASAALGNTPTIARKSYVDPRVVDHYRKGRVLETPQGGSREKALLRLLGRASKS
jgi:DNA topoisomerase-1